jgi:hypothetical protein
MENFPRIAWDLEPQEYVLVIIMRFSGAVSSAEHKYSQGKRVNKS